MLVSLHLAIVFLRMLSSGSYSLEANALLYDIIDTAKVYFNLLRYLKWYGGTLSATAAQRLGHEPHAAKDERRPGAPPETAKKGGVDKRADAVGEAGNGAGLGRGEARADKESKHDSSAWAVLVPNFFVISGYNSFLLAGLAIEVRREGVLGRFVRASRFRTSSTGGSRICWRECECAAWPGGASIAPLQCCADSVSAGVRACLRSLRCSA